MKLYAYTIIANKEKNGVSLFCWSPGLLLAEDREAAENIAKETAHTRLPVSEGYTHHNYDLVEAPPGFMVALFAEIKPPVLQRYDEHEVNWPESVE